MREDARMLPSQSEAEVPLLEVLAELGGRAAPRELYPLITKRFPQITADDLAEKLAHGESKWHNRVQWVRQRLIDAGDMESGGRGVWMITNKGRQRIAGNGSPPREMTPRTFLELYDDYEASFRKRLLERLLGLTPTQFEHFAKRILIAYGFVDVNVTRVSKDGGIDGYGKLTLGLATLNAAFQCKRWQGTVERQDVDQFRGAIQGEFEQGLFFTTSNFSRQARDASLKKGAVPVILFNGEGIVRMMIERGIGVERTPLYAYEDAVEEFAEDVEV